MGLNDRFQKFRKQQLRPSVPIRITDRGEESPAGDIPRRDSIIPDIPPTEEEIEFNFFNMINRENTEIEKFGKL